MSARPPVQREARKGIKFDRVGPLSSSFRKDGTWRMALSSSALGSFVQPIAGKGGWCSDDDVSDDRRWVCRVRYGLWIERSRVGGKEAPTRRRKRGN